MRINQEVGCIFDVLTFLSYYMEEVTKGLPKDIFNGLPPSYHTVKQVIQLENITIPRYMYPLLCRQNNRDSFLHSLFFDRKYSACTFERLRNILNNKSFTQKSFVAYYVPNSDEQTINNVIRMENPDIIDMLAQHYTDNAFDSYFFYIILNFDKVVTSLYAAVLSVYSILDNLRSSHLPGLCHEALNQISVFHKLKTITNASNTNENDFTVSLSLFDAKIISYRPDERNFILLGYDFEMVLDTQYKYSDITLHSFGRAIDTPVKNDIFNALLHKSHMTAAELGKQLNLSRNMLNYNIKEMIDSRLLIAEPINKSTYMYHIDYEYLRVVSGQLTAALRFTQNISVV